MQYMGMPIRPRVEVITRGTSSGKKAAARQCPGCHKAFQQDEPYPDVEMCEVCERYGPPKDKATSDRK